MKEAIQKLKFSDGISIWKYMENDRNYPGWNFVADKNSQRDLLELLQMMKNCEWSTSKSIKVKNPTNNELKIPNNRSGNAKWKTKDVLVLSCKKDVDKNYWKTIENEIELEIQFGENKLYELQNSILKIGKGEIDFAICDVKEENILYFW